LRGKQFGSSLCLKWIMFLFSCTQVFEWFKRFKKGREEIRDDQCLSRPSTSKTEANIETVSETVRQNRHLSILAVFELINIDKEIV
jgi:hypothetical protein